MDKRPGGENPLPMRGCHPQGFRQRGGAEGGAFGAPSLHENESSVGEIAWYEDFEQIRRTAFFFRFSEVGFASKMHPRQNLKSGKIPNVKNAKKWENTT